MTTRSSGVLLAMTSLPGPQATGSLGEGAIAFLDFLKRAGQRWWQMLPTTPVGGGDSPYSSDSAFAMSPLLIDHEDLVARGLLRKRELGKVRSDDADYDLARSETTRVLRLAHRRLDDSTRRAMATFRAQPWLDDYALFHALHDERRHRAWLDWPAPLRDRDPDALDEARERLADEIDFVVFQQWLCDVQWKALRKAAKKRGIGLVGDIPIFVAFDSADVWANRDLFKLDRDGRPTHVAGVPPDYFSETGQRWGNPLYAWDRLRRTGYAWWIDRVRTQASRFDWIRLDHFIGFHRYWAIPADEETAINGAWRPGPGRALFDALEDDLGSLPFLAEDLGKVTRKVRALSSDLQLPGMRVLQFELGNPGFSPDAHPPLSVAYTGTHDNDTAVGWYRSLDEKRAKKVTRALGGSTDEHVAWTMMQLAMSSKADTAIVPMQDVLALGSSARMNVPGKAEDNWTWRVPAGALTTETADRLRALTKKHGRA